MSHGQVQYAGKRDDTTLHSNIENVFEQRIAIQPLGSGWVALPKLV
jgi:putative transposon-encoded protein